MCIRDSLTIANDNQSYSSEVIHQINEILKDTPIRFDDLNLKYFQHYYAKLMNQIELMNGFRLSAGLAYHHRTPVKKNKDTGLDIKDQFKDGIYSLTMKEDVMLVVKAKEIDKMFKLTIDEIEGGSIDVQVYVGGDLADVPADGNIKNGTMLMISEPVLEDGYELVSVMLNEEDITALFEEGVYFHTMRQDVTISVKTNYVSGVEEEQADRVRIYPNPFAESCVVSGVAAGTSVRVFNMTGACVFSKVAGTGETEIRLSGLASGVYILKLEKDGDSSCHKLIRK